MKGTCKSRTSNSALTLTIGLLLIVLSGRSSASQPSGSAIHNLVPATNSSDAGTEIKIDNFAFVPGALTVKTGTRVIWVNHDDIPHTVDSTEGKFRSGALDTDDHFQFLFMDPGEYQFFCRLHPKMTGKIIVQP
ncbi:MAG TPA: cupredoxin family copper-binding protein [Terriglobales bacterium]|nr:cupredoxin family copper-binding protein [Terriglobales bacterium]